MMLSALALSIRQLGDPPVLRVFAKSIALTLVLLATLGVGLWFGSRALAIWLGAGETGGGLAGIAALLGGIALGWLIFRAIAIAVIGLFADEVVVAVEARYYPQALADARPVPFARSLAMGLRSGLRAILINLAASPIYVLLLVTGIGTAIGFFAVNAVLLGRDLGDMVAVRHMPPQDFPAFRRDTRARRWLLGGGVTALMLVPFINLVAPLLGAAMATHMFHRRLAQ